METLDDVLAHHGVKGMKWGIRSKHTSNSSSTDSPDAQAIAESMKKIKSGGTKALSTKELQDLVNRMNLDQQYSKLSGSAKFDTGKKFVKNSFWVGKTVNDAIAFVNSPAGKLIRTVLI